VRAVEAVCCIHFHDGGFPSALSLAAEELRMFLHPEVG
jgi:hypothetical protein